MTEDSLLELARSTPPPERTALFDRECARDPELRRRLETLLQSDSDSGESLSSVHQERAANTKNYEGSAGESSNERSGEVIAGKYKLLQKIGEGGMGTVWMADQTEPVKRRVAVKLINAERGSSKTILSRFEAERQAIALMDHPNISKLLDAGTTDGDSPFFVMELVKGVQLTEFCDTHQLTIPQRLHLFQQICSAVQHAHQKGIIHRDLKPSNILVESHDGKPVPKVIDFGLAKATSGMQLTERTLFTGFGMVAGTPLYMAPEQAHFNAVDVDTRADVYSLGVLLYELLTGTTPISRETYKSAPFDEMLRLVREQEAPSPSSRLSSSSSKPTVAANRRCEPAKLGRFVKGELDWIVMKALAKERDRRYETANAFAKDVERFLSHEPVQAGPPSVRYRLRKFARRNRPQVIGASLVLLALVAGIVGTSFGLIQANRAKLEAQEQRVKAEQAEDETLADYRASTNDAIEQLIGSKAELGPQEKAYLEKTLQRWQAYAARQGDDERSRAIRGEGHFHVALVWAKLGRMDEARTEWEAARAIQKKLVEQFPSDQAHQWDLAATHNNLGNLLAGLGEREEARAEFQAARSIRKALVEQFPDTPKYQQELASTHNNLGILLADLGHSDDAREEYNLARNILLKIVEQFSAEPEYQQELAIVHNNLGNLLSAIGPRDGARAEYQAARDIWKNLVEKSPDAPKYRQHLAIARFNLGNLLKSIGKDDDAQLEYEAARDIQRKLVEQFPAVPAYQQALANTYGNLGNLFRDNGNDKEARAEYETAIDIKEKLVEKFPEVPEYQQSLANSRANLGILFLRLGLREEALAEHKTAIEIEKNLVTRYPDVPVYRQSLAASHGNFGNLLADLGQNEKALAEYQACAEIEKKLVEQFPAVPDYQTRLGGSYCNMGVLARNDGKLEESLEWFDLAIGTLQAIHNREPRDATARTYLRNGHDGRALAYDRLRRFAEAVKDWDRAIELSPPAERRAIRADRALSLFHKGMVAEAVAEIKELTAADVDSSGSSIWSPGRYYNFACICALASDKLADKKQEYADLAMELLQQSVAAGNNDVAHMSQDADLDALRGREDFKTLMAELEEKAPVPQ